MAFFLSILLFVFLFPTAPQGVQQLCVGRETWVMGTRLRIQFDPSSGPDPLGATEGMIREVERLERILSTWDPSSEISRVNTASLHEPVVASPYLVALLSEVESWSERTARAFDPRVGSLVDAWDLRGQGRVPEDEDLSVALSSVLTSTWALDPVALTVERGHAGTWIDTDGFGKGAALRGLQDLSREGGPHRALIDLGGHLLALAPADDPWLVDVAHPSRRGEGIVSLSVAGVSVATTGNSERYVVAGEGAVGHILDPRTGRPAPIWGSVTVVSRDPLEADILSTALYVMGPREGLKWSRTLEDVGVLFLEEIGDSVQSSWNSAMERWLRPSHTTSGRSCAAEETSSRELRIR